MNILGGTSNSSINPNFISPIVTHGRFSGKEKIALQDDIILL